MAEVKEVEIHERMNKCFPSSLKVVKAVSLASLISEDCTLIYAKDFKSDCVKVCFLRGYFRANVLVDDPYSCDFDRVSGLLGIKKEELKSFVIENMP